MTFWNVIPSGHDCHPKWTRMSSQVDTFRCFRENQVLISTFPSTVISENLCSFGRTVTPIPSIDPQYRRLPRILPPSRQLAIIELELLLRIILVLTPIVRVLLTIQHSIVNGLPLPQMLCSSYVPSLSLLLLAHQLSGLILEAQRLEPEGQSLEPEARHFGFAAFYLDYVHLRPIVGGTCAHMSQV